MSALRLTRPQLRLLAKAEQATFGDTSGRGYAPWDRTEVRVVERLAKLGLVTIGMPTFGSIHGFVRVTDAGRSAALRARAILEGEG